MFQAITFSLATIAAFANSAVLHTAPENKRIAGQYVVRLDGSTKLEGLREHITTMKETLGVDFELGKVFENLVSYNTVAYSVRLTERGVERMLAHSDVLYIEEDHTVSIDDCVTQTDSVDWGTARANHVNFTKTSTYTYDYTTGATGKDINAYIIDTGIYCENNDLNGVTGIKRVGSCTFGFSSVTNFFGIVDETDGNGHGTHCAGTVAGQTWGIAKEANLIAVKVLGDNGSGSMSGVIDGIDWVAEDAANSGKKSVANMSLGGSKSQTQNDAVAALVDSGVTVAVAAGNDNSNACDYSPASEPRAITVAATDINNARASYSNYGPCVDIFGPGSSITSSWIGKPSATKTISGTSMASPQVAGTAAKVLSANPNLTPDQVAARLLSDASDGEIINVMGSPNKMVFGTCTL